MRYMSGELVRLGDRVRLANDDVGSVVLSIDTGEFTEELPKVAWQQYSEGIVVKTDAGALVMLRDPNEHELCRLN